MLIKPDLPDEKIVACLQEAYGLDVATISFLPIGADFKTAIYQVTAHKRAEYFLKLRSGEFLEASVSVPKYLADSGIKQVIPPIPTQAEQLWVKLDASNVSLSAILYPYVKGSNAAEAKLSKKQWAHFGTAIKKIHDAGIPSSITKNVPRETFSSKWRDTVRAFLIHIKDKICIDPIAAKTATFIKAKSVEILKTIERIEYLASSLQKQALSYVLCHADLHGWNLLIDKKGELYIVDWDTLIFAPKERDLMFMGAGIWDSGLIPDEEEALFYQGYGPVAVNQDAISYYRGERIIQDICEYCEYIFLSKGSDRDRLQSFEYLQANFLPNGTLGRAFKAYNINAVK
jgi:spectinomycin phosphotransferase